MNVRTALILALIGCLFAPAVFASQDRGAQEATSGFGIERETQLNVFSQGNDQNSVSRLGIFGNLFRLQIEAMFRYLSAWSSIWT